MDWFDRFPRPPRTYGSSQRMLPWQDQRTSCRTPGTTSVRDLSRSLKSSLQALHGKILPLAILLFIGTGCENGSRLPLGLETPAEPLPAAPGIGGEPQQSLAAASPSQEEMGLNPIIQENGRISLSVDGLGTTAPSDTVQVDKPAGATVRVAYLAAASTGFSNRTLSDGDVQIDGSAVAWDRIVGGAISNFNHWADVTDLVKPKIDAAPPGRVDFEITEVNSAGIDGEILAVIFDDPNQDGNNTVVLLFGAQNVNGDTFAVNLAEPVDRDDSDLRIEMALGISFGCQAPSGCAGVQFNQIDVNGSRLTSSAGGQDDGALANGALLTVGGLDDTIDNPPPFAPPAGNPRTDDELYDLRPFTESGDTEIEVFSINPSNDDNIFFASFFLTIPAAVNEEPPQPPIADAGGPYSGVEGSPVVFDGSGSSDPDGDETDLSYEWNFGDGSDGSGVSPTHTYTAAGNYTVILTVTDADDLADADTTTATITVTGNTAPTAEITSPEDGATFEEGETITFSGNAMDPEDGELVGDALVWTINGLGQIGTGESFTLDDLPAGIHTVLLTATDSEGASATAEVTISIQEKDGGSPVEPQMVEIDIKPGIFPNTLDITTTDRNESFAVAIFSTDDFDATTIDPASVTLGSDDEGGTPAMVMTNGKVAAFEADIDGDGDQDLIVYFCVVDLIESGDLTTEVEELILLGRTTDGTPIRGSDSVEVVSGTS